MRTSSLSVATPWVAAIVAAVLSAAAPVPSHAAGRAAQGDATDHEHRIKELEDTVRQLKNDVRKLEVAEEDGAKQKPLAGWQDGFYIQSPDSAFNLRLGAYTQADGRFFIEDKENRSVSQFTFRRARLNFEGTLFKYFSFRVQPDFAGNTFRLFDAYLEASYLPQARLRFGKFKPPVGLERLQSATNLIFVGRGLPTNLVPSRDNGVQLSGDFIKGALGYAVGVFNGVPDLGNTSGDINDDKDFAARAFAYPFKDTPLVPLRGLGLGISGTYGHQKGSPSSPDLPAYASVGQSTFFSYESASQPDATNTAVARGPRWRISPQGYYYWGAFGLLGEYASSAQRIGLGGKSATVRHAAWQIAASYVLTGEAASYKGVTPAQPFDPWEGRWGAFEAAARYGALDIDGDAFSEGFADPKKSARQAREWVVGVNWYLNKNIRLMLDYGQTEFAGGAAGGDRKTEKVILSRVQLAF